ncbi:Cytochrome oxidase assembly protein ShyY1 [Agreia bicolorata]|uniref:SURF1-like protein n=1 Tax=Agreia bicolorata TaxID=110935 RepID=A0A1T4X4C1_9MICO|nr:SURF1 family protein [Agreia bicolorata]KJC63252.1 sortase [Agreia bicolorata]SKA84493.1 Cytochrome oxidase assembly protein ShyY1 [Agreia bicolorata]
MSAGWQFLISRRWGGYLALTIVFALVCVLLGFWQLARRADAVAENNRVAANYDAVPRPVADVLDGLDSFDESQKWMTVSLTGSYLESEQLLVRNRPSGGQPGFELLVPFRLDDGSVFIVDRGWLPTGQEQDKPDVVPSSPSGEVTVVARLKASEPKLEGRSAAAGEIPSIDLPTIAEQVGEPTYTGAYGDLASESPSADTGQLDTRPPEDEGPHLSYAFQWFVFALLGFLGLGYAARQEYRALNADDPEEKERAADRERRRKAKAKSDNEVEDELIDRSASR